MTDSDRYETKTYDMASVYLEEGWYSRKDLMDMVEGLNEMNRQALAAAEPGKCDRKPCERGADGYCARCHEERYP